MVTRPGYIAMALYSWKEMVPQLLSEAELRQLVVVKWMDMHRYEGVLCRGK